MLRSRTVNLRLKPRWRSESCGGLFLRCMLDDDIALEGCPGQCRTVVPHELTNDWTAYWNQFAVIFECNTTFMGYSCMPNRAIRSRTYRASNGSPVMLESQPYRSRIVAGTSIESASRPLLKVRS